MAVHDYLNFATVLNDVFAVVMLFHCPAICSKDMNWSVVLVTFTSRPSSLPACKKISEFSFVVLKFFAEQVNMISVKEMRMRLIQMQTLGLSHDPP